MTNTPSADRDELIKKILIRRIQQLERSWRSFAGIEDLRGVEG
jgi:hypothetical protein